MAKNNGLKGKQSKRSPTLLALLGFTAGVIFYLMIR
jgi:hypothetical protein